MCSNETCVNETYGIGHSEYVYVVLTAVTSGLSMIGGLCICLLYVIFRDLRTPSRKLLLFLAISDGLLAFGNLLGVIWFLYSGSVTIHKSKGYCVFQSAMTIYFSITSFFWTVTMAISLFTAVVLNKVSFTATYMKLFHLLAWIPPGIIVIIALSLDVLGTDTTLKQPSWCWIDPRAPPSTLLWQFVTGKLFEIVAYITTVVLYSIIKIFLRKQSSKKMTMVRPSKTRSDVIADANRKLTFVPLVFIVCRIWGTLRFLLGNFAQEYINEPYVTWITPLQGIGDSAQGFANCVLYCFSTAKIRRRLARYLCPAAYTSRIPLDSLIESHSKNLRKATVDVEATTEIHPSCVVRENITNETTTHVSSPIFSNEVTKRVSSPNVANEVTTHVNSPNISKEVTTHVSSPNFTKNVTTHVSSPNVTNEATTHASSPSVTNEATTHASSPSVTNEATTHVSSPNVVNEATTHASSPSVTNEATTHASSPSVTNEATTHASSPIANTSTA